MYIIIIVTDTFLTLTTTLAAVGRLFVLIRPIMSILLYIDIIVIIMTCCART